MAINKKPYRLSSIASMCFAFLVLATASPLSHANYHYACKIPKSYYKHVSCTSNSRYFLAVKDSGHPVAIIGKDGRRVIDLMGYTKVDANKLRNGVLPVQRHGKVGYVNMSGREVVPTVYDVIRGDKLTSGWARAANNNRIIVKKGGKFGIISTSNQIILPFDSKYKTISDYKSSVAKVYKSNETLRVDTNARRIAHPNISNPSSASTDKSIPNTRSNSTSNNALSTPNNSAMTNEIWQPKQQDGRWGFVNSNGIPMITFSFDAALPFSEGLAAVRIGENWGFVNLAGSLVIPFRFDESGIIRGDNDTYLGVPPLVFKNGKAWIGNLNNGIKLCIDKEGVNVACDEPAMPITKPILPTTTHSSTVTNLPNVAKPNNLNATETLQVNPLGTTNKTVTPVVSTSTLITPKVENATVNETTVLAKTVPVTTLDADIADANTTTDKITGNATPVLALRKIIKPKVFNTPTSSL